MGILEHDKIAKREVLNRQSPGLRFWSQAGAHNTTMVVDEATSIAEITVDSPKICQLKRQHNVVVCSNPSLFFSPVAQSLSDFLSGSSDIKYGSFIDGQTY